MTMAIFFNYNHYNYISNYNNSSMTSTRRLQHNFITLQRQFSSITMGHTHYNIYVQWHQLINYNTISSHENISITTNAVDLYYNFYYNCACFCSLQLCSVYPDVVQVFQIAWPSMVAGAQCVIVWYVISRYAGGDRHGMVAGIPQDQSRTDNSWQTNHFEAGLSRGCHSA